MTSDNLIMKSFNHYIDKLMTMLSETEFSELMDRTKDLTNLAFEYLDMGEHDIAFYIFMADLAKSGPNAVSLNGLAISMFELNHLDIAMKTLTYSISLYPEDAVTHMNLGSLYWEKGNFEKAVYHLNIAIELNDFLMDAYFSLIDVYYENGDIILAYMTALELEKRFPDEPEVQDTIEDLLLDMAIAFY